jgi:hypothetical protein
MPSLQPHLHRAALTMAVLPYLSSSICHPACLRKPITAPNEQLEDHAQIAYIKVL